MILMQQLRKLLLGSDKPNKEQLKVVSGFCANIGLLLSGSVIIRFFVPSTEEVVNVSVFLGSAFLVVMFFAGSVRILKEVSTQ